MHPHQILTLLAISIGIASTQEDLGSWPGLKLDLDLRGIYQNAEDNLEAKLAARVVDRAAPSYHSRRKGNQYSKEMGKRNEIFKNIANRLETEFKMEREEAKSFAKQALVEHRTQGLKVPPPKWEVFKTSWPLFDDQPRTLQDAIDMGWTKISDDCDRNATFPGHRYAPPKREKPSPISEFAAGPFDESEESIPEIIVIYDENGYIAGVHHVVTSPNRYEWVNGNQWYQTDEIDGKDVEMTTLYFVDPHRICHGGRTEEEFEEQGTGNRLWLKNGPRPMDFLKIPLTKEDIEYQGQFFEHKCVPTQGTHWASSSKATSGSCNSASALPIGLLTDQEGDVNGFLIFLFGEKVKGYRYELPNEDAANFFMSAPKHFNDLGCFLEYNRNFTSALMHVYLKEDPGNLLTGPKVICP